MQLGMVGLGRMGANLVRRLMRAGHECVVYDINPAAVHELVDEGAVGAASLAELAAQLTVPRAVWVMVPAGVITGNTIEQLSEVLSGDDTIIDGGNSHYHDDLVRAETLSQRGLHYVDVGTSGGVWGLDRGYCLMIGGEAETVQHLDPIWAAVAPGAGDIPRTAGRVAELSTAERGYLHCGPAGSGHFVKMVHNGIEYGLMAAYAEGFNILKNANVGAEDHTHDAETAPLENPHHYQYDLDVAQIAEVWRRGSVVQSWLLDLTANALAENPELDGFSGRVSDSGEGRWTAIAAIESGVPAPVLTTAVYGRFDSRDEDLFANKVLSAMRKQFGGHDEKAH